MHLLKLCIFLLVLVGVCIGENKYYLSPAKATFLQSLAFCRRFGMKLLTINTEEKNSDLYNHFARLNETHEWYWTSAIYQSNTMTMEWYWLEGDKRVEYSDWRQNDVPIEPNYYPDTDNCLRWGLFDISNAGKGLWRVDDCNSVRRFVCERPYSGDNTVNNDHLGGNS